jgi:uncharacterized protein YbaP (TraB family)
MRLLAIVLALLPLAAHAQCSGRNLIAASSPATRSALQAAADSVPFATGNLWHATRGALHITLVGTYHLDDPRHAATVAALAPDLASAKTLLVEAGPDEVVALKADLAANPTRLIHQGPTLPETLTQADWARLTTAVAERGLPAFLVAKMQPWYVSTLLAIPACLFDGTAMSDGLDQQLMRVASAAGLPIVALEPFDTLFTMFNAMPQEDQIEMLLETLATTGALEDDMAQTLADSYFAGQNWLFWEFSRQQALDQPGADPARVARLFALIEDLLMTRRNRAWLPVIEAQAAKGPLVVAFGALHLAGENGVLNLLARNGWTVTAW